MATGILERIWNAGKFIRQSDEKSGRPAYDEAIASLAKASGADGDGPTPADVEEASFVYGKSAEQILADVRSHQHAATIRQERDGLQAQLREGPKLKKQSAELEDERLRLCQERFDYLAKVDARIANLAHQRTGVETRINNLASMRDRLAATMPKRFRARIDALGAEAKRHMAMIKEHGRLIDDAKELTGTFEKQLAKVPEKDRWQVKEDQYVANARINLHRIGPGVDHARQRLAEIQAEIARIEAEGIEAVD